MTTDRVDLDAIAGRFEAFARDEVHGTADDADGQRVGARVEGDVKGLAGEDEVRRHAGLVRRVRRVRRRGGGCCRRTRSTRRHSARTAMLRLRSN